MRTIIRNRFCSNFLFLAFFLSHILPTLALANGPSVSLNGGQNANQESIAGPKSVAPSTTNQTQAQNDTEKLNKDGAQKSNMLGMLAIAAGGAMIAIGASTQNYGLVAAGVVMTIMGMQGMQAGKKMNDNAGKANFNAGDMSCLGGSCTVDTGKSSINGAEKIAAGIKIDDSFKRSGKSGKIFDEFEKRTGINRDDLIKGLEAGVDPAKLFANAPKIKGKLSEAQLAKAFGENAGKSMSGDEVMKKLGITDADLKTSGSDTAINLAGGGAGKTKAAAQGAEDFLAGLGVGDESATGSSQILGDAEISPEVQAALDKNGITARSLFEMVKGQYKKKTPMLFGADQKAPAPEAAEIDLKDI